MPKTAFIIHPETVEHDTGNFHPESPDRIRAIINRMEESPVKDQVDWMRPDEAPISWIDTIHDKAYIRHVEEAILTGQQALDAGDTLISEQSFRAARLATGGALRAVDAVLQEGAPNAFSAARPPGHHACEGEAMGFCLFNHIAIAARYAQQHHGLKRVFILDWDVHHGNGTQDVFYEDASVLFASLHQYPFYPGTGAANQTGGADGKGYTINCPVDAMAAWPDYERAFMETILPRARAFEPELVMISAGFDAHRLDPLAHVQLETGDFVRMTEMMRGLADAYCDGRIVSVLEGGYNLDALADCVEAHLGALSV